MITKKNSDRKKNCDIDLTTKRKNAENSKGNQKPSRPPLSKKFGVSLGAINKIIKNREELKIYPQMDIPNISSRKRKFPKTVEIDNILYQRKQNKRRRKVIVSSVNIIEIRIMLAKKLAIENFIGWKEGQQKLKNGIICR
ncbi:hypothetical protein CDIK_1218 [Cucumispora dikerogammari]|nr:hypothetical protein CDIK_1218 [Cucumispora dikerogammari]